MNPLRFVLSMTVVLAACSRCAASDATLHGTGPCVAFVRRTYRPMQPPGEEIPAALRNRLGHVAVDYAERFDLDCDGAADFVVRAGDSASSTGWVLKGFVSDGQAWREVLRTPSNPESAVQVVLAVDFDNTGHLTLVTMSADEGGYVPQVFAWRGARYEELAVPSEYRLRYEEQWDQACRDRIVPRLLDDGRFTLLRETLSPASATGHGAACELPRDTLSISDHRLKVW